MSKHKDKCLCKVVECLVRMKPPGYGDCCEWLQASGSATQQILGDDTPNLVVIDSVDESAGSITHDAAGTLIGVGGDYLIAASCQVGRDTQGPLANFRCWLAVNGTPVPRTNVFRSLSTNGVTKDVVITQVLLPLKAGDVVTVWAATNDADTGVKLEAIQPPSTEEPLVPSIRYTVAAICCDSVQPGVAGCEDCED